MPELFEKTAVGTLELANRAVRSATWTGLGDERGSVTDRAIKFYAELGRGGVGLIITGYQYILPNGIQLPYMIGNYADDQIDGLTRLADAVHAEGGKVVGQIVHCGSRANPKLFPEPGEVWVPSSIPDSASAATPREVDKSQIRRLVEAYAAAASRLAKARFDGVQLHGAHGYGINQFISPAWNRRGDEYGGNAKKRYRFLGEVLEAVRGAVGADFPILIKLSGHDHLPDGLRPQDSFDIGRRLSDDGINAIEVSGGNAASPTGLGPVRTKVDTEEDEAYFADLAAGMKEAVTVPVIAVGGIRSLKTVTEILTSRKADYVAMSRPFIREPGLINRWQSGDAANSACISCAGCFATGLKGEGISCKEEPKRTRSQDEGE